MATPSYKGYQTSVLAGMGNDQAIQQSWSEVPGYDMFSTGTQTTTKDNSDAWTKDREVEVGLGVKLVQPMSDIEKTEYVNSLTDDQYRQMQKYKNEGYSFEASRTLLENSDGLKNPTAYGTDKYTPKGSFFRNIIGGAGDSATGIGQFIGNGAADIIGRTAKKLGADAEKVDYLVNDFKNYLEDNKISKTVKADTSGATYKITKGVTDLAQAAGIEGAIKGALPGATAKLGALRSAGLGGKVTAGAIEGAATMVPYNIISEGELPSGKDLALGAAVGAAFPLAGAGLKATKDIVKKGAGRQAERIIEKLNKVSPTKLQKFEDKFGENMGKVLNDRGIKTRPEANNWFISSKNKVDEALNTIKGTFKSQEVTDVLNECVAHAEDVLDKKGLERLLELQKKDADGLLTMSDINEIKRYFEGHTKFTYLKEGGNKAERATNLDTALRDWQRKTAAENGLENLAQLNRETQMAKEIVNASKDPSKTILGAVDVTDELLAIHYGGLDRALATYATKSVLKSDWFKIKAVDILNRLAGHQNIEAVLADLEAISKVNTEKEFDALMKKRELGTALPAPTEGAVNEAGYNILKQGEDMVSLPNGNTVIKDTVTEIPNVGNFQ